MMAAEATQSNPVDAAKNSTEPIITISVDSQNVDDKQSLVNGAGPSLTDEIENKHLSDTVDNLVNSTEVSVSGGSDTEAGKDDGSKYDLKGHTRTSSTVKKPTSFKSVSVNKTFLGNKAQSSGTTTPKNLEKASSTPAASGTPGAGASAVARPRLVAKLGTTSRDGSKASGGTGGKPAGAPDPSTVWTKNRPPPPIEPKKLTDEELKKYGIHMTARLAPEDTNAANNWADVDDDDDDWIPSEIQWNDGTKVTIPTVDETATLPPAPAASELEPAPAPVPTPAASTSESLAKDPKLSEKPKSPAPAQMSSGKAILGGGKGLVLKGAPEKPTLVARPPPPPAPVKSPWATLPPVNKSSPVLLDTSAPQVPGRNQPRETQSSMRGISPPAAKEIAADDFSRSNGPVNPNRELFNSQSGRYEPVTERRGPGRVDPHQRHPPAVLQRVPHGDGPPGPSPAFQTNRSDQEAPYGRRRGSSNVSGGSGSLFQRGAKPHDQGMPPQELLHGRRTSFTGDSPVSPSGLRQGHGPVWQARTSPYASQAAPYPNAAAHDRQNVPPMSQGPPQGPTVDDYELQKKLMAEKLQAARQRKAEEEAKAEAEKQKRIAAKLAALGPAPERKSAKQAASKEATVATKTSTSLSSETPATQASHKQETAASNPSEIKTSVAGQGGETKASPALAEKEIRPTGMQGKHEPVPNAESNPAPLQDGKAAPPWQGAPPAQPSRFSWGPTGGQPAVQNVWGAPNNNRSLGNGTFNADLGRLPDGFPPNMPQISGPSTAGPGPIGPPNGGKAQAAHIPKPIAPPSAAAAGLPRGSNSADDDTRSRWAIASKTSDERMTNETRERMMQQQSELEARGASADETHPAYHDSWKPVKFDSDGRRIETKDRIQVVHGASWKSSAADERTAKAVVSPTGAASTASPQSRTSRFFPVKTDGARPEDMNRHRSPSPPPPDMDGHPAFDGDATHPHVALPPSRPVVRLPPSMGRQVAASNTGSSAAAPASFNWATPRPFQESQPRGPPASSAAQQSASSKWQSRINDLLHDSKTSSQTGRMAIDSTSRRAMDSTASQAQATVSLPGFAGADMTASGSPTSKVMAEECFEEQEMGSLPAIRIPTTVPDAAWNPSPAPARSTPKRMWISPTTIEVLEENPQSFAFVCLQGMTQRKRVHLPTARSYSTSSRSGPNNNSSSSSSSRGSRGSGPRTHASRGGNGNGNTTRSRESSTPYSNDAPQQSPSSSSGSLPPAPSGRGRGSYRRPADWGSRRTSTPLQT
ncbi:hypothetical protein PoMZ_06279 [Pyricularia oryzae]|uniref:Uncharacterized protein n=1 Tax=Pyricularia oryzae TaxID=318829 RepID=A0A4P7NQC1_PYROR|nr:hypothetical protein PoMZ_06279 [Pyricularia oryzae]